MSPFILWLTNHRVEFTDDLRHLWRLDCAWIHFWLWRVRDVTDCDVLSQTVGIYSATRPVCLKRGDYRSLDSSYTLLSPPSLTRPIFVVHLEGPAQLLLGRPAGRHVRGHHELLQKHEASAIKPPPQPHTLKSMLPLPSLSNIRKIWSTNTLALPAGSIMEYISRILSLLSWPSGQSCLNPL